jgi:hypothetical protein
MRGLRMLNPTGVGKDRDMVLTRMERERITDSRLKIQSIANSLSRIDAKKVPDVEDIQECLEDAERSLSGALQSSEHD